MDVWIIVGTALAGVLLAVGVAVFMVGDNEEMRNWFMERFFKYEAKAEEKALEKGAEGKLGDFAKGRLEKNPLVPNEEIDEVTKGIGGDLKGELGKLGGGK